MKRFLLALAVVSGLAVSATPARAISLLDFVGEYNGVVSNAPTPISDSPLTFLGVQGPLSIASTLTGGATFNPTAVTVVGSGGPGLAYNSGQFDVSTGQTMDVSFEYKVTTSGPLIHDNSISLSGAINGDGKITVTENVYSDAGLTTQIANTIVFVISKNEDFNQVFDQAFFTATSGPIYVTKDIKLDGGTQTKSHAAFSTMTQDFSLTNGGAVPEPSTIAMALAGVPVLALVWARRRRKV